MAFRENRQTLPWFVRTGITALAFLVACGAGEKQTDTTRRLPNVASATATIPAPAATRDSTAPRNGSKSGTGQMADMTGDADHDFLRTMSDHHKGLIHMAHMTKDRKEGGTAVADATKLDAALDTELDRMMTMLEKDFKDAYAPKVLPDQQAMADELETKSGNEYDRAFYQSVITQHQNAVKVIDDYLPRLKNAMVKKMAETMKSERTRAINDFEQKVSKRDH